MQRKVLLVVLLVGLFYSVLGQSDTSLGSDNPDFDYICGVNADMDCIRNYFANSGQGRPVNGVQDGQAIIRIRQPVYLSKINLTVVTHNGEISFPGLVFCEAFYMNTQTGNLVLSLHFDSINIFAQNTEYIISRRSLEPIRLIDFVNATYNSLTLTAVIPASPSIQMQTAAVSAYILNPCPTFIFGPSFSESSDELVARTHRGLLEESPTAVQEIYLTDAFSYFLAYFENYIYDFGVPYSTQTFC